MASKKRPYEALKALSVSTSVLSSTANILGWDQETYMPEEATELRGLQLERLADLMHREKTSRKYTRLLSQLVDLESGTIRDTSLSRSQQAAVREWRRDYLQTVKLPAAFVRKFTKETCIAIQAWKAAKEKNRFKDFLPHLKKIIDLSRKKADYLGYKDHPYDALIDLYEPETKTARLTEILDGLKNPLTTLLRSIHEKPKPTFDFIHKGYPHNKQLEFNKIILDAMALDKSFCRLDETIHPMCISSHPSDIRITTHIYQHNPFINILSVIHEGGHALYDRHLPKEEFGTPLGEPCSHGIHESQSRLWEAIIAHSLPFWKYFFPKLQQFYPEQLHGVRLEELYQAINLVKPSLIRTDSDEVSYNLHIIVRFEIEKALIEGTLDAKDIPEIWNEKMKQYIGITPKTDAEGCLQDIHWACGNIAYFPTYTLGNLYAAQFYEAFRLKHPEWEQKISHGNFSELRHWLATEIHRFGREYLAEELCKKVTGKPLSEKPFLDYLQNKYKQIYP